jgi:hypothetical protein
MRRVLTTGSSGYIGARLVGALADKQWVERVIGIDLAPPRAIPPKLRFVRRDVRKPALPFVRRPWIATSAKPVRETGYRFRYDTRGAFLDFVRCVKERGRGSAEN